MLCLYVDAYMVELFVFIDVLGKFGIVQRTGSDDRATVRWRFI